MTETSPKADWIALDWGTSHLRVWAMSNDGEVRARKTSGTGMGTLTPSGFEPALLALTADWLGSGTTDMLACGMVGSRQGWVEAPYRAAPCTPLAPPFVKAPVHDARVRVHVVPGVKQSAPFDVMRGEETQIAGFLAERPDFEGLVCLPGTHTKWAEIGNGHILGFKTFMTGELFALLSGQSILRHSMPDADAWDDAGFHQGVAEGLADPGQLPARLFALRAENLLADLDAGAARARLSGLLIGAELGAMKDRWQHRPIALIGARTLAGHYRSALASQGAAADFFDGEDTSLKGLAAARAMMMKELS